MKIRYQGESPVDIPGRDDVNPGDIIDVDDELAAGLLVAGTSYPDDGPPVPPASPLWVRADTKAAKAATTEES